MLKKTGQLDGIFNMMTTNPYISDIMKQKVKVLKSDKPKCGFEHPVEHLWEELDHKLNVEINTIKWFLKMSGIEFNTV